MTEATTATPRFVRFKQACAELGMSTDTGYAHVRAGFPHHRHGRVDPQGSPRTDLEQFVNGATTEVNES